MENSRLIELVLETRPQKQMLKKLLELEKLKTLLRMAVS